MCLSCNANRAQSANSTSARVPEPEPEPEHELATGLGYPRGASQSPPSGGSVSSTEAGRPWNGSSTAVTEP
ncbi:hypothetical protein BH11ACT5_BH11ACT5_24930 [soil metagenome]